MPVLTLSTSYHVPYQYSYYQVLLFHLCLVTLSCSFPWVKGSSQGELSVQQPTQIYLLFG